jgi:hypothetical protein
MMLKAFPESHSLAPWLSSRYIVLMVYKVPVLAYIVNTKKKGGDKNFDKAMLLGIFSGNRLTGGRYETV